MQEAQVAMIRGSRVNAMPVSNIIGVVAAIYAQLEGWSPIRDVDIYHLVILLPIDARSACLHLSCTHCPTNLPHSLPLHPAWYLRLLITLNLSSYRLIYLWIWETQGLLCAFVLLIVA